MLLNVVLGAEDPVIQLLCWLRAKPPQGGGLE